VMHTKRKATTIAVHGRSRSRSAGDRRRFDGSMERRPPVAVAVGSLRLKQRRRSRFIRPRRRLLVRDLLQEGAQFPI
jgi:hypothetical protein